MSRNILNDLLSDYEHKRTQAELDADERKKDLYNKFPVLSEIETELNTFAITTAKNILNGSSASLEDLNNKIMSLKKQKKDIFTKNNLPEDYLEPQYSCKKCNDTGYIRFEGKESALCPCLKQKLLNISYNKSNISNLDKENFDSFNPNLFSDEVNYEKYKVNISPRDNIIGIKKKCLEFVDNFDEPDYKNLLFTGNTGLGKTFVSNCIANEMIKKGKNVLYQTAPVLLESVIDYKLNKYKYSNDSDFYKNILEADLLIIDDLGTECINSMKLSELFTILNTRLLNLNNRVTKTIISTNLGINNIFKIYEERIGSRIAGFYDVYYFFGDDIRFKRKT